MDKDGRPLPDINCQPPAFYRYSPQKFAKEAPDVFEHDPETNLLKLREGKPRPWLTSRGDEWLYCADCWGRWLSPKGLTAGHVPFRDKASQGSLKKSWGHRKRAHEQMEQPQAGAIVDDSSLVPVVEGDLGNVLDDAVFDRDPPSSDDEAAVGPAPPAPDGAATTDAEEHHAEEEEDADNEVTLPTIEGVKRPTLEEYMAK